MAGTLWLVGTPIGNLDDVTERARTTLDRVDLIACEDTRRTRALLAHLGVRAPRLVSYFEGNEARRVPELLGELRAGRDVALVSDAGMPAVSDPGERLVAACVADGIHVDVAPGPSAVITALAVSGLPTHRFVFEGFLPARGSQRRARLAELASESRTLVLFESPRRLPALLADAEDAFGDRRAAVIRELTKVHQEVVRGRVTELVHRFGGREARGEVVVVIEGAAPERPDLEELGRRVAAMADGGVPRKEAAARVSEETGASKRALYEASLWRDEG